MACRYSFSRSIGERTRDIFTIFDNEKKLYLLVLLPIIIFTQTWAKSCCTVFKYAINHALHSRSDVRRKTRPSGDCIYAQTFQAFDIRRCSIGCIEVEYLHFQIIELSNTTALLRFSQEQLANCTVWIVVVIISILTDLHDKVNTILSYLASEQRWINTVFHPGPFNQIFS